jgi:hypothetical protein
MGHGFTATGAGHRATETTCLHASLPRGRYEAMFERPADAISGYKFTSFKYGWNNIKILMI